MKYMFYIDGKIGQKGSLSEMIAFMGLGCYTRDRAVEKKREKRELLKQQNTWERRENEWMWKRRGKSVSY